MSVDPVAVRTRRPSTSARRAGIGAAMLLAMFAAASIARAPAAASAAIEARHQHLQGLLWLHSPDYLLISAPPARNPNTFSIHTHSNQQGASQ